MHSEVSAVCVNGCCPRKGGRAFSCIDPLNTTKATAPPLPLYEEQVAAIVFPLAALCSRDY